MPKSISGIGKPAVPPVIPALVAFAGGFGGLWSLTLGQDPSNALPHWSPVSGWAISLGSLALASVLAWMGLVRRKCPDCGSSQMLDAMEEEGVAASERFAAQKAAVEEARTESRTSHDKDIAEGLAAREKDLRVTIEQELRTRLVRELEPQIEHGLRGRLEKELRFTLGNELRQQAEQAQRSAQAQRIAQAQHSDQAPRSVPPAKPFTSAVTPRPVTPGLSATAKAFTLSPAPQVIAGVSPPRPAAPAITVRDVTPSPVAPFSAAHAKVETAPLSLRPSPGKAPVGKP